MRKNFRVCTKGRLNMLSMTGYGRGEHKAEGLELTVEIKTVNNRYFDVSIKSPKIFLAYEEVIRSKLKEYITRGHIDVFISFSDKRERQKSLYLDESVAKSYIEAAKRLKAAFPDRCDDLTINSLLRLPDVIKADEVTTADDELISVLEKTLELALQKLNIMRGAEGEKLAADFTKRMATIEKLVGNIQKRAPLVADEYREKLKAKIEKYLDGVNYDEGRFLSEVALFADKSNIDEELTRLNSHIAQFRSIMQNKIIGRQLDFLVQEFNRETNTICSKSNDITITQTGLELKNEIEKVREQVQNVE